MSKSIEGKSSLLASIIESSNDSIISGTVDGIIQTWNPAAEKLYGYSSEEMIGKSITLITPENRLTELKTVWDKVKNGQSVPHFETLRVAKNGSMIMVSLSVYPIRSAAGEIIGIASIARDVTESKTAAKHLRNLIEASPQPVVTIGAEGTITYVNEATTTVTGVPREELIGTDFSDYFAEPDKAREVYQRVFAGETVTAYPLTICHRNGVRTDVLYSASAFRDAQGMVFGAIASTTDATESKRDSEYARSLIEASLDPLVTIGIEGKITDVNEATVNATGVDRMTLIGTDFSDYFSEPDKAREVYQRVFAGETVTAYPLTICHRNGVRTHVLYNASVYRDAWGKVLGVFAAARDVTEQKLTEDALAAQQDAAQQNKELQQLAEHDRLVELERFQRLTIGRELKMIEMKKEIERLKRLVPVDDGVSDDQR